MSHFFNERLGVVFHTSEHSYFYDAGTHKTFQCGKSEVEILDQLLHDDKVININHRKCSNENFKDIVKEENLLQAPVYTSVQKQEQGHYKIEQLILEVTEICNLRCKYCIYHDDFGTFRSFSENRMSLKTAISAIDFALNHSGKDLVIGFYGGEPLVEFDLIKKCISYIEAHNSEKKEIYFSITTNLTLITPEIAKFLGKTKNMLITCSIDGPQKVQDNYRITENNTGSFAQASKGLELLIENMGIEEAERRLIIHSVVCPPIDQQKYDNLKDFFDNAAWLPKGIKENYTYVAKGSLPDYKKETIKKTYDIDFFRAIDPIRFFALQDCIYHFDPNSYAFKLLQEPLLKIHELEYSDYPCSVLYRNGCCNPGSRKIYVTTKGEFKICERVGNSPSIGNILEGVNFEHINTYYIDQYDQYILEKCNHCWAMHSCPICYAFCYNEDGLDKDAKDDLCESGRDMIIVDFICYYELLEHCPEAITYLDNLSDR